MRSERVRRGGAAALSGLVLVLGACALQAPGGNPAQAAQTRLHPISGLKVIDLTVTHGHRQHHFRVEVAGTPEAQERGLMFRTAMGADEGMIFPMANGQPASFWMKNTVMPLDIIFIGLDGRIGNIAANARPYDETPLYSLGAVSGVLELNGGRAAELGIGPGDLVKW